jgi:protein-tyrosine phosphatase
MDASSQPPVKRGEVSKVTDRILITDVWNAFDPVVIWNHRVTHVLSVMRDEDVPALARAQLDSDFSRDEKGLSGLTRLSIPIADSQSTSLLEVLPRALAFIDDALKEHSENILLVHCYAGISRSPSCVIAHLMDAMDISMLAGFKKVREARPCIRPNEGFLGQLRAWGKSKQARRNVNLASALPFSPSDDSGPSLS